MPVDFNLCSEEFQSKSQQTPIIVNNERQTNEYFNNRKIGDEYNYILKRQTEAHQLGINI